MTQATDSAAPWDLVVSSPLVRCAEFAKAEADRTGAELRFVTELQEIDFGVWEGKTAAELMELDAEFLNAFWQDPMSNTPPDGEPMPEFVQRVSLAWDQLVQTSRTRRNVLIVSHGGVIRSIVLHILEGSADGFHRLALANGGVVQIRADHMEEKTYLRITGMVGEGTC